MKNLRRDKQETTLPETPAVFPVDLLDALEHVWQGLCDTYDVAADLPDTRTLFEGADLTAPEEAAETVLANMLLEVMYSISRFSPWYKKPLGLRRIYDESTDRSRWALSPKTYQQWQELLKPLSIAIKSNVSVILAADLLESMEGGTLPADQVTATCLCVPPRLIRIKRAALINADIVCDTCRQPFRPVEVPDAGIEE